MGKIISAFAGVGKSYVGEKYNNVLDLDWTYYKWLKLEDEKLSIEQRKGSTSRVPNPNWPQNYVDEIIKQKDNYDIVLIPPSHERLNTEYVFKYFDEHNIEYYVARPNLSGWKYIEKRLKDRGNTEQFISQVRENFNIFLDEFSKDKYNQIIIDDGKFLEDALIRDGFLKSSN